MFGPLMKKDDMVVLWYLSANRDEDVFDDGEAIKVDRDNARRHLSFGYGIHRCVGARVAELQLIILSEGAVRKTLLQHLTLFEDRLDGDAALLIREAIERLWGLKQRIQAKISMKPRKALMIASSGFARSSEPKSRSARAPWL